MTARQAMFALGFIGFGEAAFEISSGLKAEGFTRLGAYDKFQDQVPISSAIQDRAKETNISLSPSLEILVKSSDVVLSANSSSAAVDVAEEAAPFLNKEKIFVDINAASPETMEQVARVVEKTECRFVDAAVMGPVPKYRHKVPILACGSGAVEWSEMMSPLGMNIQVVGEDAGRASAIKMLRSVYMKSAATALLETCLAAHHYGVVDFVMDSLAETWDNSAFLEMATRLIGGTAIHAGRRVHEMEDVVNTLTHLNVDPIMSQATVELLKWMETLNLRETFSDRLPQDYRSVLDAISDRQSLGVGS